MATSSVKRQKRNNTDDLICPILLELPIDPVTAEDGRVYEKSAIEEYFQGKTADLVPSPLTQKLIGKKLLPAHQQKNHIETLIENGVIKGDLATTWKDKEKQKKYMEDLLEKAEKGDVEAMWIVGIKYYRGWAGFQENNELAYFWVKKVHAAGKVRATALLGEMLVNGLGVEKNFQLGTTYLGIAAKDYDAAAYTLGMAFAYGKFGLPIDTDEARRLLQLVANGTCTYKYLTSSCFEKAKQKLKELNDH